MKLFSIVGARPQFIKLAPLSAALGGSHEEIIVHTGQHYDYAMSEKIFNDLGIRKPDIHLGAVTGEHAVQTADMMVKLEAAMTDQAPDAVIVFGDTNSTLAGALAASKLTIPIIHIEAGLRSYNMEMPEEINRIVADHVSRYLFAPTQSAMCNLKKENLENKSYFTGDIMVDTIKNSISIAQRSSAIIQTLGLEELDFSLLTLHRNYNVDNPVILEHILQQVGQLDTRIIFPVHPRTRKMLASSYEMPSNIHMTEPLGYLDFIMLEYAASRIITDSGGIQKEAYILQKPCITLRTETEWIETVQEKWNCLINPTDKDIAFKIAAFNVPGTQEEIFGNNVAQKMARIIDSLN